MAESLSQLGYVTQFDPYSSSTIKEHRLGEKALAGDKTYRYAKIGAVAAVPGKMYQAPAVVANHTNLAATANAAIGATTVTFTLGATAVTADQYAEGYLNVNDATGEGHSYRILSHPAADASASLTVTLAQPIKIALVSSTSEVSLVANPYSGVVIAPTTLTGAPVGVPVFAVAAGSFGWLSTGLRTPCLIDGTPAVGASVSPSNAVSGAVEGGVLAQGVIGVMAETGVDTEYKLVDLFIQ